MTEKKIKDAAFKTSQEPEEETAEKKVSETVEETSAAKEEAKKPSTRARKTKKDSTPESEQAVREPETSTAPAPEEEDGSRPDEKEAEPAVKRTLRSKTTKKEADTSKEKAVETAAKAASKPQSGEKEDEKTSPNNEDNKGKKEAVTASEKPETKGPRKIRRRLRPYKYRTMEEKMIGAEREIGTVFGEKTDAVKETMIGLPSEDIFKENQRFMISDEERDQNLYKEMIRYQRYGEILWGTLVSTEEDASQDIIYACILWNDIIVKIPDYLFFEPTYRFGVRYESMSKGEKLRRRLSTLTFMLGAKICFVIDILERKLILDKYDVLYNTYELTVGGNRCRAMEIMRDIFFFHENRKETTRGTQREIKEGDILNARIVQVKEESVLVECGGVETRIPASLLSARDYYTNCTDVYSSGDMIKVRVKKVYINKEDHTVHLSLTGQVVNPVKAVKDVMIGSAYLGTVVKCNEKNHTYTIMLSNGVPCTVFFEFVFGHIPLVKGDKVRVTVSNIYADKGMGFVSGSAQKL